MERHIRLEGGFNLRDLGGYAGHGGRIVRSGSVFRSDALHSLTDADVDVLSALGIRVVVDLRNQTERARRPNRVLPGVEVLERVSPAAPGSGRSLEDEIATGTLPAVNDVILSRAYVDLLDRLAPEIAVIVERAVHAPAHPVLFHCAAGKDRTGVVSAILLGLLGVGERAILDDYELTSAYYTARRLEQLAISSAHGLDTARLRPLLEPRQPALQSVLDHIHGMWGGFDGYAIHRLGVHCDVLDGLRSALLVASSPTPWDPSDRDEVLWPTRTTDL